MSSTFTYISTALKILTGLFLLASCLMVWRLLRGMISGRLILAPFSHNQIAFRLFRAGISLLLPILWWGVVPYLLKLYLPVTSCWLKIAICTFAAILMLSAVFPANLPLKPENLKHIEKRCHALNILLYSSINYIPNKSVIVLCIYYFRFFYITIYFGSYRKIVSKIEI